MAEADSKVEEVLSEEQLDTQLEELGDSIDTEDGAAAEPAEEESTPKPITEARMREIVLEVATEQRQVAPIETLPADADGDEPVSRRELLAHQRAVQEQTSVERVRNQLTMAQIKYASDQDEEQQNLFWDGAVSRMRRNTSLTVEAAYKQMVSAHDRLVQKGVQKYIKQKVKQRKNKGEAAGGGAGARGGRTGGGKSDFDPLDEASTKAEARRVWAEVQGAT